MFPSDYNLENPLSNCSISNPPTGGTAPLVVIYTPAQRPSSTMDWVTVGETPYIVSWNNVSSIYNGANHSLVVDCDGLIDPPAQPLWASSFSLQNPVSITTPVGPETRILCQLYKMPDQASTQNASVRLYAKNYTAWPGYTPSDTVLSVNWGEAIGLAYQSKENSTMEFIATAVNDDGSRLGPGATVFLECWQVSGQESIVDLAV
jgi:hypothetical protein